MFKNALWDPKHIIDKTMYKMHVSFCFLFLNILSMDLFS